MSEKDLLMAAFKAFGEPEMLVRSLAEDLFVITISFSGLCQNLTSRALQATCKVLPPVYFYLSDFISLSSL